MAPNMLDDATTALRSNCAKVLNVVTSSLTVDLLRGQSQYLRRRGFDVWVVSPAGRQLENAARIEGVATIELRMARDIAPIQDLVSIWRLWRIIRRLRPTVTNVGTPKAGLLGGFAAWLNRVPCRFYTLRGLRFETTRGLKRRLLVYADRLACAFAHRVICVSASVRETAVAAGLTNPHKAVVFGSGSSNGVDASRFAPTAETISRAAELRRHLGIPAGAPVIGFVGRLTRDKGIPELVDAFSRLRQQFPDLRLLLLGRFEPEDPLPAEVRTQIVANPRVILVGHQQMQPNRESEGSGAGQGHEDWPVNDAAPYYALMDVFILPSHREGLPNVVLEAQAAGKPVVAAHATGTVDAIVEGKTGLLFPVGDARALAQSVAKLLSNKDMADRLGHSGRERIRNEFRQEQIWEALYREYLRLLHVKSLSSPAVHAPKGPAKLAAQGQ